MRLNTGYGLLLGLFLLISAFFVPVRGQVPPVYSQYFINPYVYNPALAGIEGHHALFFMYRYQWVGIEGAPQVANVNWHAPVFHGLNLGAMLNNERLGALQSSFLKTSAAYLVNLDGTHFFRFGLSVGAGWNSMDFNQISGSDIALAQDVRRVLLGNRDNRLFFIADFGMMYHFGRFNVGFSLPSLVRNHTLGAQLFSPVRPIAQQSIGPLDNIIFKINYRQSLANDALALEPQLLYRYAQAGRNQYEGAMIVHIKHIVWVGMGYRQYEGFLTLMGFKVAEMLGFGYSYDTGMSFGGLTSEIGRYSSGTHEVHLGFHIGNRKKHAQHHSSFIKSHAKTREEREAEVLAKQQAELEALLAHPELSNITPQRSPLDFDHESDLAFLENEDALLDADKASAETEADAAGGGEGGISVGVGGMGIGAPALGGVGLSGDLNLTTGSDVAAGEEGQGYQDTDPTLIPTDVDPTGASFGMGAAQPFGGEAEEATSGAFEWGAVARHGQSRIELPPGSYVIVGSFRVYENAVRYSDYLLQKGAITQVGYNSERGFYYIDAYYSRDLMEARRTRDRMRQNPLFSDAWVITIIPPDQNLPITGPLPDAPYLKPLTETTEPALIRKEATLEEGMEEGLDEPRELEENEAVYEDEPADEDALYEEDETSERMETEEYGDEDAFIEEAPVEEEEAYEYELEEEYAEEPEKKF